MEALQARVRRIAPDADVSFVPGDVNARLEEVISHLPKASDVLFFCFVDPYSLRIRLETLRRLSSNRRMDFLVLLALQMDARRNFERYVQDESSALDAFLGNRTWRERWEGQGRSRNQLIRFLAEEYTQSMEGMGYVSTTTDRMYLVRTNERRLPIYYLAFFSKHERGYDFWDEVLKYSSDQGDLFGTRGAWR